jgi:hypothetical protein
LCAKFDGLGSFDESTFLDKLPFAKAMNAEFSRLLASARDRRILICLAPEGVGKSWWGSKVQTRTDRNMFYVRINSGWKDKQLDILQGTASVLGVDEHWRNGRQFRGITTVLKNMPDAVIIFDEAHLGGVAMLKVLKDLVDETPARFVYLAYPTQFDSVRNSSDNAMAEVRQVFRRCLRPVFDDYRDGVQAEDVQVFLAHQGVANNAILAEGAKTLVPILQRNGNLSLLQDAVEDAQAEAEDTGKGMTFALVEKAVRSLCSTAPERRAQALKEAA